MTPTWTEPKHLEQDREGNWYDKKAADRVVAWFPKYLVHLEGPLAGQPFVPDLWQVEILRRIFGWKRPDGTRLIRTGYIEIPRKNGKSTFAAGIVLYMLFADGEPSAHIYGAAADIKQAGHIFRMVAQMVRANPVLKARARITDSQKTLVHLDRKNLPTGSFYRVLSSDSDTAQGINPHLVIFDELHVQPNDELYNALKTALGARSQPLMLMLTTAGYDRKSICWRMHVYAEQVRDGVVQNSAFLPIIYNLGPDDDWTDPHLWIRANPSAAKMPQLLDAIAKDVEEAVAIPGQQNAIVRYRFNIWTSQESRAIRMSDWEANQGLIVADELKGRPCYGGLDLATITDVAALCLLFPPQGEETKCRVLMRMWVPEGAVDRRSRLEGVPYRQWASEGWLRITPGDAIDFGFIREDVLTLSKQYRIKELIFDRWGAHQVTQEWMNEGLRLRPLGQGFKDLSAPTKELMRMLLARELNIGGHPVMRWMADNLAVMQDPAGNIKPAKDKSKDKIDGIVALIIAIDGLLRAPKGTPRISFIG